MYVTPKAVIDALANPPFNQKGKMQTIEQASTRELEMEILRRCISRHSENIIRTEEQLAQMQTKQTARIRELAIQETIAAMKGEL